MPQEIELIKRSKVERLVIANTLLDSVSRDIDNNLISKMLNECIENITDCLVLIERLGD